MLMKMYHTAFTVTLASGTIIACSANSWFTCWLGLEINLMSLIPLLIIKLSPLSTETAIKYFLAQAMASLMIIFSSLTDSSVTFMNFLSTPNEIILIALCVKAGMAPFHFWFPQVMKISGWAQCMLIMTWQKVAPFVLIVSTSSSLVMPMVVAASAAIGSLGGLNQTSLKMILTYSSIAHSAWMLAICSTSSLIYWGVYFLIYTMILISIVTPVYKLNTAVIFQTMVLNWPKHLKISFMVSIMSLGGLPPFLGFLAKLGALQLIMLNSSTTLAGVLIISSLVSLYYYLRVIYLMLLKTSSVSLIFKPQDSPVSSLAPTLSLGGNIVTPLVVLLI